ncbi:DDT domain-containing protein DDR4 isoform X1 [Brassica rapa]|uniref:DDT domain-containing protein DDR4 isoform X1 n=1 Tax=Brassica campestris TaxID=3711 RepID=UPI0004F1672C|nr:DDT domain-containing protein DDR4 isoform X1 [Brassica rapa]XP_022544112.1 DDT domain-containing protein DDR4-like isoform X1 [Brassica napus]
MGSSSDLVVPDSGDHRSPADDTQIPAEETASLRRTRPSRACTVRAQQRLQEQQAAERKLRPPKKEYKREHRQKEEVEEEDDREEEEEDEDGDDDVERQCGGGSSGKIVTSLVQPPEPSQMPRWNLRSMWELASVLNFLHVFRPLLKINAEFSAEEFETALLNPNDTLSDIHIPLLKAIPPVTRMALTRDTWVTVLCRKIRDCWHWVAEGDLPIVASQGREIEAYKYLDPAVRVVILKALCDIRVEQEDIRSYIDNSVKTGVHLSTFRKDRVGGDSHGVNFWYEDDPLVGHRLYREIRKAEVVKVKTKGSKILPNVTYQWETVATNFDEFQDVSEKLNSSSSRTEVSLGKKLTRDMLPEIEKEHKRKEKLLKKQHRQALLLDNYLVTDGVGGGRSLRDRKPVRYTFDDYDRSINEAIKITTNQHPSQEPFLHRRESARLDSLVNGRSTTSSSHPTDPVNGTASGSSSDFADGDEFDEQRDESLDRSNRRRQRPQRYSATDFVETDNHVESGSDDDIVGEAVYDEEYLRKRKQKTFSSGSEGEEEKGDEEYKWDEDNAEYEEEEEEEEDSPSASEEDSDEPRRVRKMPRRETKLRSKSNGFRPGLRRSKRATRIDYQQYELSESDNEAAGAAKRKRLVEPDPDEDSDESGNGDFTMGSEDSEENGNDPETNSAEEEVEEEEEEEPREVNDNAGTANGTENNQLNKSNGTDQEEVEGVLGKRHFLDLNELAPVSGFDDGPSTVLKDDDKTDSS